MTRTNFSKKTYGWGDLIVLTEGHSYTCVIHPEHLVAINREEAFTDEQGIRWDTQIVDGMVTLRNGNNSFTIPLAQLNA